MNTLAIVVSLVGKAWAKAVDGTLRVLQVGDSVGFDETLIVESGARIDLDFGGNQQITLLGNQQISGDQVFSIKEKIGETPAEISEREFKDPTSPIATDFSGSNSGVMEGHNFVQLVRIGEIIEADGITPFTVARIQEVLSPLGMMLDESTLLNSSFRTESFSRDNSIDFRVPNIGFNKPDTENTNATLTSAGNGDEDNGSITYTVTLDNALQTDQLFNITLSNGQSSQLNVVAGATTGAITFGWGAGADSSAIALTGYPDSDAYVEPDFVVSVTDFVVSGNDGNVEKLTPIDGSTDVTIGDTVTAATITLSDVNGTEGESHIITASVDYLVTGSDLVITLSNGEEITIAVGASSGASNAFVIQSDDVFVDGETYSIGITGTTGGNFENLIQTDMSTVTVLDSIDAVYAQITVDQDSVLEGGVLQYTVGLVDETGNAVIVAPGQTITVDLNWSGLAATIDDIKDFAGLPASVTIGAGSSEVVFYVETLIDNLVEYSEPLNATITSVQDNQGIALGFESLQISSSKSSVSSNILDAVTPVGVIAAQADNDAETITAIDTSTAFSDADLSNTLTYSAADLPAGLSIDPATGIISGTIDPSASQGGTNGVYNVVVTATDDAGATATQGIVWTVSNPAPDAVADTNTTDENAAQLVVNAANGVLINDTDADGDTLTVSEVNGAAGNVSGTVAGTNGGSFILNADGSYTFNDNGDFEALAVGQSTTTQVTYTVTDSEGGTDTATLTITVTGTNDGPTAVADTGATTEDSILNVAADGVLNNDTDPDTTDTLVVTQITNAAGNGSGTGNGLFTVNPDGSYSFNPNGEFDYLAAGETETSTIDYTISDGNGGTSTASITVTITGTNDAPTAVGTITNQADADADVVSLATSGAFTDTDLSDTLTYSATGLPAGLTIDVNTGVISGTVDNSASQGGAAGVYSVVVTASDGTSTADQSFDWTVTNPAPVGVADTGATTENSTLTVAANGVLSNDTDADGDALVVSEVAGDAGNLATAVAGNGSGTGNGEFTVNGDGSYSFNPNGEFDYLAAGETETSTINYTVSDGEGGTSTASITVTITGTNDAPTQVGVIAAQADNDAETITAIDTSTAFSDADLSNTLTYSAADLPAGLSIDPATGIISGTIDPSASQGGTNGVYNVVVTATDDAGATATQGIVWTVSNPAPDAVADTNTTDENAAQLVVNAANGVLINDTDADGDTLTVSEVNGAAGNVSGTVAGTNGGSFILNADGSYTFNDNGDFEALAVGQSTTTQVTYTVTDSEGGTDTATLTITVTGTNDGPTAVADTGATTEDSILNVAADGVLNNDTDPDTTDTLVVTQITNAAGNGSGTGNGLFTVNPDGSYSFNPNGEFDYLAAGETETSTIDYTISDGNGGTSTASITVTITGTNDAPVAVNDAQTFDEDTVATGNVLSNDSDVDDGAVLTVTEFIVDGTTYAVAENTPGTADMPGIGVLEIESDGSYTFTPAADYDGVIPVVSYTVSDGSLTDTGTLTLDITSVDDSLSFNNLDNGAVLGTDGTVTEVDLAAGNNPGGTGETVAGSFDISAPDGISSLTVGATVLTLAQLTNAGTTPLVINTTYGELTINGFTDNSATRLGTAELDYSYTLTSPADHSTGDVNEVIALLLTDSDGDTQAGSLAIKVIDDAPIIGAAPAVTTIDEQYLATGSNPIPANTSASENLAVDFGADEAGSLTFTADQAALQALLTASGNSDIDFNVSGNTLTATRNAGAEPVFTVTLAINGSGQANYTFELQGSMKHIINDTHELTFGYQATDNDGDAAVGSFAVNVVDDAIVASDQDPVDVLEGTAAIGFDGSNWSVGTSNLLSSGADGNEVHQVRYNDSTGTPQTITLGGSNQTVATQYGSLTVNADGTWSYTPNASITHTNGTALSDLFSYTMKDGDGDISGWADQPINVTDSEPVAIDDAAASAVEGAGVDALDGNVITNDTASSDATPTTIYDFVYSDAAGDSQTHLFVLGVDEVTYATPTGDLTVNNDGNWTFTPNASFDHDASSATGSFSYRLVDDDGSVSNSATQSIVITDTDPTLDNTVVISIDEKDINILGSDGDVVDNVVSDIDLNIAKSQDNISDVVFNAATITQLVSQGLSSGGTGLVAANYSISNDGHTLTATAGGNTVFVLQLNHTGDATGDTQSITMTLSQPLDHANASGTNNLAITVGYAVSDIDSTVSSSLTINVRDDIPTVGASEAEVTLAEGGITVGTGSGGENLLANDTQGADGARVHTVTYNNASGVETTTAAIADGGSTGALTTQYGSLTVNSDGTWSYTSAAASTTITSVDHLTDGLSEQDNFSYNIIDADGDVSASPATQEIKVTDTGPAIGTPAINSGVDEANLATGSDPVPGDLIVSGSLAVTKAADSINTTFTEATKTALEGQSLESGGVAVQYVLSDDQTLIAYSGAGRTEADKVFTVVINNPTADTASYQFTLQGTLDHPDATIDLDFGFSVTDSDGDSDTDAFRVTVTDDVPTAVAQAAVDVPEGVESVGSASGGVNLITGGTADTQGADGAEIHQIEYINDLDVVTVATLNSATTGELDIKYGKLTVNPDGTWSYISDAAVTHVGGADQSDQFRYNLIDGDGDVSNWAAQPLNVTDTTPVAADDASVTTTEGAALLSGNLIGNDTASADGTPTIHDFTYTDAAGDSQTFEFLPLVLTQLVITPTGALTVNTDGSWNFVPDDSYEHDATGSSNAGSFGYRLIDDDGSISNTANQPIVITDTSPTLDNTVTLAIDEENINGSGSAGAVVDNEVTTVLNITKDQDEISDVVFNTATITQLVGQGLSSGGVDLLAGNFALTNDGHTLTATAGGNTVFVLQLINTGDVSGASQSITMTLGQPLDHVSATGENNLAILVGYAVSDIDSTVSSSLTINVTDDIPVAPVDDTDVTVVESGVAVGSANTGDNLLNNDTLGADGGYVYDISYTNRAGVAEANVAVPEAGLTVDTQYGELTVQQDGTWSYTPIASADHVQPGNDTTLNDDFSYRVIDNDGDINADAATQTITVTDTVPTIDTPENASVDEEHLPTGADPTPLSLTKTGSLDVTTAADSVDTTFTAATTTALGLLNLTSGGEPLGYALSSGDHVLTATANGVTIFTVTITNPTAATAAYSFTLSGTLDHKMVADIDLPFSFTVTDSDGDTATDSFTVTVADDIPELNQSIETNEDVAHTFNTSADADDANTTVPAAGLGAPAYGVVTVNADGTITYTPNSHYSGTDSFTYTTTESGGVPSTTTVAVTVNPVADRPTLTRDSATITTNEDEAIALGLNAPIVVDSTDQNAGDPGDNPELLGLITLSGLPDGLAILDGTNGDAVLYTSTGANITIELSDGSHHSDVSGATLTMTTAQFEALKLLPPSDSHSNFTVTSGVRSYEVDVTGVPLVGVAASANRSTSVNVQVQAVTDPITLTLVDGVAVTDPDADAAHHTIEEDTSFNLKDLLTANFDDLDGSEARSIDVTGLPVGTVINGTTITALAQVVTINAPNLSTSVTGFPNINITPPPNFSGDINNISITLNAQDQDSDGIGAGATTGAIEVSSVTLNLHVTPVADAVTKTDVATLEDTPVEFLDSITLTDIDGSESITAIVVKALATGWVILDADDNVVFTGNGTADHTVLQADVDDDSFRDYTVKPPAHSSADDTITVEVTTTDGTTVNGVAATDSVVTSLDIDVTVTAVAEQLMTDSDGDTVNDLTMNNSHGYTVVATEDIWFDMSQENALDGWNNQDNDGSEETFALFTPTLTDGSGAAVNANGAQFQYDNGTTVVTQTYSGTAIKIPAEFISTVQFKAPNHFSGNFSITVSAETVDTDPDTGLESTWTGGAATLTGTVNPVADDVRLSVTGRARGDEDTDISLSIRPTSSDTDSSETFTVTLSGIPADTVLIYDGAELILVDDGSGNGTFGVTIEEFDRTAPMTIRPAENSNVDFSIGVSAVSVDELGAVTSTSGPEVKSIDVIIKGVADQATLTTAEPVFTEAAADAADPGFEGFGSVSLNQVITGAVLTDSDGSEKLTLSISGLDPQLSLIGGAFIGGTGTGRTWLLTEDQLATAKVLLPTNFSGTVTATVVAITTENDGNSLSSAAVDLEFTVTQSIDEAIKASTDTLQEDTLGKVDFSLVVPGDGDDRIVDADEYLSSIWIDTVDADTANYTLYFGMAGKTLAQAVTDGEAGIVLDGTEYKITGAAIDNIYAQGAANAHGSFAFDVGYEITDLSSDGTLVAVSERTDTTHALNIAAVTDAATLVINSIISDPAGAATITDTTAVHATENTELTVNVTLSKDLDANAGNTSDYDGSEVISEIYVDGVPAGVTVVDAVYIGNIPGDPNTGRWLLTGGATGTSLNGSAATFDIKLGLTGTAANLSDLNDSLSFNVVTQDASASELVASDSFTLTTPSDFDDTNAQNDQPAVIATWEDDPVFNATEDVAFSLDDALNGEITGSSDFAITITGFPAGTNVSGMTLTTANGVDTWTVSGSGSDADLQALLATIQVNLPENWNDNNKVAGFEFETTLTTYAQSGAREESTETVNQPVTPVTDSSIITISNTENSAEDSAVVFTVDIDNAADGAFSNVVDGKLYLQLTESGMSGGTLSYEGAPLALQEINGVEGVLDGYYYVANIGTDAGNGDGTSVALTYQPPEHQTGTVELEAWAPTQETGASNIASSTTPAAADYGEGITAIYPVNDGFNLVANDVNGDEDTLIELDVSGTGLIDTDGSETISSVLLTGLPAGYLVYTGATEGAAVLADNAGTDGWSIPVSAGQLPAFIGVRPPLNVSGATIALTLTALTVEMALLDVESSSVGFDLTVDPVADGLSISPENSTGVEGDVITIDVNPSLIDIDELVTLQFSGLGEYAAFYAEGNLLTAQVSYDDLNDTYTLNDLTQAQLGDLGFVQEAGSYTVNVSAQTVDGADVSAAATDSFTATVEPVTPSAGNDTLLFSGLAIDAGDGDDTIQLRFSEDVSTNDLASNLSNIEVVDIGIDGSNSIGDAADGLSIQDVLDMTDARDTLNIEGDANDAVFISDNWTNSGPSGDGYTVYTSIEGATLNISEQITNVQLVID